jgi:GR25 family glycosyltransferase involved in LPS biosynthesis
MTQIPFYIVHYRPNVDRKRYLDAAFASLSLHPQFITDFDREDVAIGDHYRYDEARFRDMLAPIKDTLMGYVVGLSQLKTSPWAECVELRRRQNTTLDQDLQAAQWLRPRALRPSEVSVFLKHHQAWERIAASDDDWAVIAEDDILFHQQSAKLLDHLPAMLPADFDYVDIAGGCGMLPRAGNQAVNNLFFAIDPVNTRTACCALMKRSLAKRLVEMAPPICMPVDWTLTYALTLEQSRVYWMHPPIFVHGSETPIYRSGTVAGNVAR